MKYGDLISRQDAVNAIVSMRDKQAAKQEYGWEWEYNGFNNAIQALPLPSAQPEITRCKDCQFFKKHTDILKMHQWDGFCMSLERNTYEDWFCPWVRRKNNG